MTQNGYISKTDAELIQLLNKENNDSIRALIFNALAYKCEKNSQFSEAIEYAERSKHFAALNSNSTLQLNNILLIAHCYTQLFQSNTALKYYLSAIPLAEKQNDQLLTANIFKQIGTIYQNMDIESKALEYYGNSYDIFTDLPNTDSKISLLRQLGNLSMKTENWSNAENYYRELLQIYENKQDKNNTIDALQNLANIKKQTGEVDDAISLYINVLNHYIAINHSEGISATYNNLGYLYVLKTDFNKAILNFKGSLNVEKDSPLNSAVTHSNLGICYQNVDKLDLAVFHLNEAIATYIKFQKTGDAAKVQDILALIYYEAGDFYNARLYSEQSILNANRSNMPDVQRQCYLTYSKILQDANEDKLAMEYYQKYLNIRDSLLVEQRIEQQTKAELLYSVDKSEQDLKLQLADEEVKDLAMKHLQSEAEKREKELALLKQEGEMQELQRLQAVQALVLARQTHEAQLNEQQIKALEQDKQIQNFKLKQQELEKQEREKVFTLLEQENKIKQLDLEKEKQKGRFYIAVIGLGFVVIFFFLAGMIYAKRTNTQLKKQKAEIEDKNADLQQKTEEIMAQNDEIVIKNQIIEEKNEHITDSIVYAKRIQTALLQQEDLAEFAPQHFILFKPRDIVSGDFYWMRNFDDELIITAADCTGHGVPGAFMSMLGISFLEEITNLKNLHQPAEILNELRLKVKTALRQTGKSGETKDGMDIALINYNRSTHQLQYAGAHNPLYLIRHKQFPQIEAEKTKVTEKNDFVLTQIKATAQPIGIYLKETPFENHSIDVYKGDCIYLFSDGILDQTGSSKNEKFKTKRFKDILLDICHLPMEQQFEALNQTLDAWQAGSEQIDDILVMGIKLE